MKEITKFSRWLAQHKEAMPEPLRNLAITAELSMLQMDMDPRSNERCPQLRASNMEDIAKFAAAYDAEKSRDGRS